MWRTWVVVALLVAGCNSGEPRLDTSSDANMVASLKRMTEGMSPQEAEAFQEDLTCVYVYENRASVSLGPLLSADSRREMWKPLDGATAEEIRRRAVKAKAAMKGSQDIPEIAARASMEAVQELQAERTVDSSVMSPEVKDVSVKNIEAIQGGNPFGSASQERLLVISVRFTNKSANRRPYFNPGAAGQFEDAQGNIYRSFWLNDATTKEAKKHAGEPLQPGKSVDLSFGFEIPELPSESFTLRVPASIFPASPDVMTPLGVDDDYVLAIDSGLVNKALATKP